ncbi:MAG: multiheme c-type cytochrome, partial [bacterium]
MKKTWVTAASLLIALTGSAGAHPLLSAKSEECLDCHEHVTPGIVADWAKSRHAHVTPAQAAQKQTLQKRVSFTTPPRKIADKVVGCAECHTLNPELHKDSFEHNGSTVHVVVSPPDCALCHPVEVEEYGKNLMSRAYGNLRNNALYHNLADSIVGEQNFVKGKIVSSPPDEKTKNDSCFKCHGSKVEVKGMVTRDTEMGEMAFPVLSGWPNQGVGRLNPDGSKGSCSACHPRHQFSIEVARKPYTCSQCHKGPDTPAYQVYMVSKHGNIFSSLGKEWNFKAVPWTVGRDFTAPTCAVCHISLL